MDPDDGKPPEDLAVQTLKQLKIRWGVVGEVDTWKTPPAIIRVNGMGWVETWRLRAPHQQATPKVVDQNTYELSFITKAADT